MRKSILAGLIAVALGSPLARADGINIPFSFPATACTNQFIRSVAAATGVGTCASIAAGDMPAFSGGDVTSSAGSLNLAIGATKVTSAMLNSDVFSTAHSWGGVQTFTAPVLGTPASVNLANATNLPSAALPTGTGFRAHRNTVDQTGVADSTFTTVQANVTAFNNGSYYNTGTYTWTPPAGVVELCARVTFQNGIFAVGALVIVQITKNGTSIGNNVSTEAVANASMYSGFCVHDSANGTDAYVMQAYGDTTSGTFDLSGQIAATFFSGAVVH